MSTDTIGYTSPAYYISASTSALAKTPEDKEKKKDKDMFDFGKITNDSIRISPYGIAVKNANGKWVSYDQTNNTIINVEIFNFNATKYIYKIPVALSDIQIGDVIIHACKPMIVLDKVDKDLIAVDPVAGEKKTIMPTRSPFGFDFVTKIISLFDMTGGIKADPANPFGNMLPFMLSDNIDPLALMMLTSKGYDENMMLALTMGNKDNLLPFMLMRKLNK